MAKDVSDAPRLIPQAGPTIRRFVRETLAQRQEAVSIPDMARYTAAWLEGEAEIRIAFLESALYTLVYIEVQAHLAQTRKNLELSGEAPQPTAIKASEPRLTIKWSNWHEHTGAGRHVRAMLMTREDCHQAAAERMVSAERTATLAVFWKTIGDALEEGQRVGDKFSPSDLETLAQTIQSRALQLSVRDRSWARRLRQPE